MAHIEKDRRKVARRLEHEGWALTRHGKEHDLYARDDREGILISVPRHRTLSPGVARSIAKLAGWLD